MFSEPFQERLLNNSLMIDDISAVIVVLGGGRKTSNKSHTARCSGRI